ncbi:MAG: alpha-1,2-fucosyltransferase [Xanthomonadales bacterium]|nr:alpha-1,2-fucosyltransferase [Xanthomonadales bacterium]
MKQRTRLPVYAWPRLSKTDLLCIRIGGNGLGNLLFTWARCLAESERRGWRMIWPTWRSYKPKNRRVNPYDHRIYSDLFRPTARYVHGWRKPWCLARDRWISEDQACAEGARPGSVVVFMGMEGKFAPFLRDAERIRSELIAISRERHLAAFSNADPAPIAIHVRCGDFVRQSSYEQMVNVDNSSLPMDWYVEALRAVRAKTGHELSAEVYSDGTAEQLAPLLSLPGVKRREYGSSLADIFGLSRSRFLIASGSTFSMWGSYLGQVPTLWHPGKLLQHVLLKHPEREFEWAAGEPLPDWVPETLGEPGAAEAKMSPKPGPRGTTETVGAASAAICNSRNLTDRG